MWAAGLGLHQEPRVVMCTWRPDGRAGTLALVLPSRQPRRILNLAVLVSSWKTGAIIIIPTWRVVCGLNESIKLNTLNNVWHLRHPHEMLATLGTMGPNLSVNCPLHQ